MLLGNINREVCIFWELRELTTHFHSTTRKYRIEINVEKKIMIISIFKKKIVNQDKNKREDISNKFKYLEKIILEDTRSKKLV